MLYTSLVLSVGSVFVCLGFGIWGEHTKCLEAFEAGKAPKVVLKSTNIASISVVKLEDLKKYTA